MKKYLPIIATALIFGFGGFAVAQVSTATHVVPGTYSLTAPYWIPIGTANPLSVISN